MSKKILQELSGRPLKSLPKPKWGEGGGPGCGNNSALTRLLPPTLFQSFSRNGIRRTNFHILRLSVN